MANRELNASVGAETSLSTSLASGGTTINVDSTSAFPAVPFAAVIDPGDDSKREVVIVDSGKTATTFTLTSASQRGQDGTTDVAHDSGAVVMLVPVPSMWGDLHDRVEAHTHSGGTDGTAIATGDLTGHDKAAHDAIGLSTSSLTGHDKAAHDSLGLDHGSLSGLGDFEADHGTGHDTVHAKVQVTRTTNTALTGTPTKVNFETEVSDPGSNFDISTDTYTAPEDGAYAISVYAKKASGSDTVNVQAQVDGNTVASIANLSSSATSEDWGGAVLFLRAGDDLTVVWSHTGSGATMDEVRVEIVRL